MDGGIFDICIVGGGVVGCSCLFDLTNYGYNCVLLEKNQHLLSEASSGNSGMLHTGFDAPANSIELECIQLCQRRVFEVIDKLGVPLNRIGATMVAWNDEQLERLPEVIQRSKQAAVSDIFQLSLSELAQREPHLQGNAKGALWIPGEAVTDPWLLPTLLTNDAVSKGAKVICQAKVESCSAGSVGWEIQSTAGAYRARCVINCAGLFGDVVDMLGGNANFRIKPRKGQYTVFDKAAKVLLKSSILPVPSEKTKGIIVFRSVYDNVIVGPTAEDVESRLRALIDSAITDRLRMHASNIVKGVNAYPTVGMYTGVRPASEFKDYVVNSYPDKQWVTVGGIRSTGVSGSLGLSDKVRRLVTEDLNLEPSRGGSSSLTKPDWHFSQRGTTVIEGKDVVITHPLTFYGNKMVVAKI